MIPYGDPMQEYYQPRQCRSHADGDCFWKDCPQLRDDEPKKSGRHCPLDIGAAMTAESELTPENIARVLLQARYGETNEMAIKFVAAQIENYGNWRVEQASRPTSPPAESELMACPFCGGESVPAMAMNMQGTRYYRQCNNCNMQGPDASTKEDRDAAWNRRPASPPAARQQEVEDAAKIVYEAMRWALSNPPIKEPGEWVEHGDSFAQDRAREAAADIAALSPVPASDAMGGVMSAVDTYTAAWREWHNTVVTAGSDLEGFKSVSHAEANLKANIYEAFRRHAGQSGAPASNDKGDGQ